MFSRGRRRRDPGNILECRVVEKDGKLVVRLDESESDAPTVAAATPEIRSSLPGPPPATAPTQRLPTLAGGVSASASSTAPARLGANSVVSGLAAGVVGGVTAAAAAQLFRPHGGLKALEPEDFETGLRTALLIAFIGLVLGFALACWEGFTSGSPRKGVIDGVRGGAVGFGAGLMSGAAALGIYGALLTGSVTTPVWVLARGVTWMLFGGLVGLGLGSGRRGRTSGLVGGAFGGLCAGVAFEVLDRVQVFSSDGPLRLIGLVVTGAGIGLGVGVVERIRKEAWLRIIAGPMRGKEVILTKAITVIGSDHRADLVLVKDPEVSGRHLLLTRVGSGDVTARTTDGVSVTINGVGVLERTLRPGDEIALGATRMRFEQRSTP